MQNYCVEKLCFVTIGVFRKWVVAIFFGGGVGGGGGGDGDCYCTMLRDALEGCSKKPYKISFLNTLLLEAKKQKKIPTMAILFKKNPFGGALKAYRNLKILKNPYFIVFPPKSWWWSLFSKKAYVKRRRLLEGPNNDYCFGAF